MVATPHVAHAAPGINLSWDECGAAGSEIKTFACNRTGGAPFVLVGSFMPPANVDEMLGLSADLRIDSPTLPDWWKHGSEQCRGTSGLAVDFDFTSGGACTDFMNGRGAGGLAYDVGFGSPNSARLRIQAAIPIDDKLPLSADTEYYAFKVQVLTDRSAPPTCTGCATPVTIKLRRMQLFQPPEADNDPVLVTPLVRSRAFWQAETPYVDGPAITSFAPQQGEVGDEVEIRGLRFTGVSDVRFNEIRAKFTVVSDGVLRVTVPNDATDSPIIIEGPGGLAATPGAFDVMPSLPPIISGFTPVGGQVGQRVTISGEHFRNVKSVHIGTVAAQFLVVSPIRIEFDTPPFALIAPIRVVTASGTATTTQDFIAAPVITSIRPDQGTIGSTVDLSGRNFLYSTNVTFNGTNAVFEIRNNNHVVATVPATALTGPITITNPGGTISSQPFVVTNPQAPRIDVFEPAGGGPGTTVVVRGARFQNVNQVRLRDRDVPFVVNSESELRIVVPTGALTGRIYVTSSAGTGQSTSDFVVAPIITSFAPTQGDVGQQVEIFGTNLTHATVVDFNFTPAVFEIKSANRIIATVPARAFTGPIQVINPGGSFRTSNSFVVTSNRALRVDRFLPGSAQPGAEVIVYGNAFLDVTSVQLGALAAEFTIFSDFELRMTVPPNAQTGRITVATANDTAQSRTDFVVLAGPVAGGFNLSWDDCGAAGSRTRTFACDANAGAPFVLVASFVPPPGIDQFIGASADLAIASQDALPDWWKHGLGACRGTIGLAPNFDFSSGPSTCADFNRGLAAGGFSYDIGFDNPYSARLRVQYAVPVANKGPIDSNTEYYAFKVELGRSGSSGPNACSGCDVPMSITLRSVQLFQPAELGFDPTLTRPLVDATVQWQPEGVPAIGPNLVSNPHFETSLAGWAPVGPTTLDRVPDGHGGNFALQAAAPDTAGEFGARDNPGSIVSVPEVGARYRFAAWVKSNTPGLRPRLRVREFLDRVRIQSVTSRALPPTIEWQYLEMDVAALAAGSKMDLAVLCPSSTPYAQLLIDDVSIRRLGSAPVVVAPPSYTGDPLTPLEIVVTASDPSGESIRSLVADFSDLPFDHDATFTVEPNNARGVLRWTPRHEDGGGTYGVVFRARSLLEHAFTTSITVRPAPDAGGLVRNPSFEGPSRLGWKELPGTTLDTASPGRTGQTSLRVTGRADSAITFGANDSPNSVTRSQESKRYRFTCWVKGEAGSGAVRLRVREYLGLTRVGAASYSPDLPLTTAWRKLVVEHVAGSGGSTLDLAVLCDPTRPDVSFFVDDVAAHEITISARAERATARHFENIALTPPRVVPNPVRGRAMLEMSLAKRGPLKVELYDLNGRRVRTLFEHDDADAGIHQFDVAGSERGERLGPGVFFYRIASAGSVRQGRFVVLE